MVQAGTGTLTLTGSNSYNGPTVLQAGTLAVNNAGNLGTLGNAITFNAAPCAC